MVLLIINVLLSAISGIALLLSLVNLIKMLKVHHNLPDEIKQQTKATILTSFVLLAFAIGCIVGAVFLWNQLFFYVFIILSGFLSLAIHQLINENLAEFVD
ncbi:hypothetical protein [Bacillus sp. NPDC094106]|uniref:hypothetical protein n=1 Tax=Bacillus sp. NPDC094106 TaxID=3363949 RepID=UPI0037F4B9AC